MYRNVVRLLLCLCVSCSLPCLVGCGGKSKTPDDTPVNIGAVVTPAFDADSAMSYVAAQVAFGPRTPGSKSQSKCASYLARTMQRWCDTVITQPFNTTLWNGTEVQGFNIISSFNPDAAKRILIAAHWDSRLWADHDPDASHHRSPIDGANDGASGVAVIMEMARGMAALRPSIGIDFIFFDIEDQGTPEWADSYEEDTWCKGSQYWAGNPHRPFYNAMYGILFDMVGTKEPRFTMEQISRNYAESITNKVWKTAEAMGYGNVFQNKKSDPILDDHYYINRYIGIPTIDIVQNTERQSFFQFWHTKGDNIDAIEPTTLKIVGDVVLKTIYMDYPAENNTSR